MCIPYNGPLNWFVRVRLMKMRSIAFIARPADDLFSLFARCELSSFAQALWHLLRYSGMRIPYNEPLNWFVRVRLMKMISIAFVARPADEFLLVVWLTARRLI